jgi:hypothetical protein
MWLGHCARNLHFSTYSHSFLFGSLYQEIPSAFSEANRDVPINFRSFLPFWILLVNKLVKCLRSFLMKLDMGLQSVEETRNLNISHKVNHISFGIDTDITYAVASKR